MQIAYKDAINEMAFLNEPNSAQDNACLSLVSALFLLPVAKIRFDLNKKRELLAKRKEALTT